MCCTHVSRYAIPAITNHGEILEYVLLHRSGEITSGRHANDGVEVLPYSHGETSGL